MNLQLAIQSLKPAILGVVVLAWGLSVLSGCESKAPPPQKKASNRPAASMQRRSERGDVLFTTVVQQLRDLASYVDTELQPPEVVLDSKSSSDGQDVLAICTMPPGADEGLFNFIFVPQQNSRFRSLGIQPGDVLKYYVLYDEESAETGISQTVSMDLTVAQVLNDHALLIEGGLNRPVTQPAKIEIWRYSDERLEDIARAIATYERYRQPVFDWEPSPDGRVLKQITERLNQWMRQSVPKTDWSADPMLATLDPEIATDERLAPLITPAALTDTVVQPYEGRLLQETVWHRDIGRWAQGESFDDLARATALFDWVIRNVQLDADEAASPYRPWETLLYGHGTAEQRAWVFALLARQQGLDVVILEVPRDAKSQADGTTGKSDFWLPALLVDGKLYLFDTRLGLPIPNADGPGVATLAEVQADDSLLRQLDLSDAKYPITTDQLQHVTAHIVADPFSLSRRATVIESKLSGDDRLVLSSRPSQLAEKLAGIPGIEATKIWSFPFRTLRDQLYVPIETRRQLAAEFEPFAWRPTLWKARVLHFQGHREGDIDSPTANVDEVVDDQREAIALYTSPLVRPPERILGALTSAPKRAIYSAAKDAASYWVGLMLFDQGKFASAEDWLRDPKLAAAANGKWAPGTRYNLARTYEAEGKTKDAIALYEADDSPQRHGNRLRARRLRDSSPSAVPAEAASEN